MTMIKYRIIDGPHAGTIGAIAAPPPDVYTMRNAVAFRFTEEECVEAGISEVEDYTLSHIDGNTAIYIHLSPHRRRQSRYGRLVRGWSWRTLPDLLEAADRLRKRLGISRTELLERALREFIERNA